MTRFVTPVLLVGLAMVLAWELVSGRAYLYVHDRSMWLIALSIPVLAAFGLSTFRTRSRANVGARILAIAVAPVAIALLIPAQPLGSAAVDMQGSTARLVSPLAGPGVPLTLDQANRVWDIKQLGLLQLGEPGPGNIDGQQADVVGFVHQSPDLPAGEFEVARFLVRCCTADAVAVTVPVRYGGAPDLQRDSWVEVQGTIRVDGAQGARPFIDPASVRNITEPSHPYLQLP